MNTFWGVPPSPGSEGQKNKINSKYPQERNRTGEVNIFPARRSVVLGHKKLRVNANKILRFSGDSG